MYQHIKVPAQGQKITVNADMSLNVPDQPIVPYIEGDGTGFDITPVMLKVVDAAGAKAYVVVNSTSERTTATSRLTSAGAKPAPAN